MGMGNFNYVLKLLTIAVVASLSISMFAIAGEGERVSTNIVVSQLEKTGLVSAQNTVAPSASCTAYFEGTLSADSCRAGEVPLQAATWLFILALIAFVGLSNKRKV